MSDPREERRRNLDRVGAFSDAVVAIIITIMVLELHPPRSAAAAALWALWPVFLAYVLSFAYVAVYWVNHHRLFAYAVRVSNGLLWSNMLMLFALSLIPFATAYLGTHHFTRLAAWLYLAALLFPAASLQWVHVVIRDTGRQDAAARDYHRANYRKGWFVVGVFLAGLALTAASPWLGILAAAIVAIFCFLPSSRIDRWFGAGRS